MSLDMEIGSDLDEFECTEQLFVSDSEDDVTTQDIQSIDCNDRSNAINICTGTRITRKRTASTFLTYIPGNKKIRGVVDTLKYNTIWRHYSRPGIYNTLQYYINKLLKGCDPTDLYDAEIYLEYARALFNKEINEDICPSCFTVMLILHNEFGTTRCYNVLPIIFEFLICEVGDIVAETIETKICVMLNCPIPTYKTSYHDIRHMRRNFELYHTAEYTGEYAAPPYRMMCRWLAYSDSADSIRAGRNEVVAAYSLNDIQSAYRVYNGVLNAYINIGEKYGVSEPYKRGLSDFAIISYFFLTKSRACFTSLMERVIDFEDRRAFIPYNRMTTPFFAYLPIHSMFRANLEIEWTTTMGILTPIIDSEEIISDAYSYNNAASFSRLDDIY